MGRIMLAMAEVNGAVSLVVKMGRMRIGSGSDAGGPNPTRKFEPMRSYVTHDCAAVRATAPMSNRACEARRRAKPGMAKTRTT